MPFIPALNTAKVVLEFGLNGKIVVNVLYANFSTTILTVDLQNLVDAVRDWWSNDGKAEFSNELALFRVSARDMTTESGLVVTEDISPPEAGTVAQASASNQVALVMTHRTGMSGRSRRGRAYLAGIPRTFIIDNFIDPPELEDIVDVWTLLMDEIALVNFTPVVASFISEGEPRETALLTPIIEITAGGRVDTQRRRLPAE